MCCWGKRSGAPHLPPTVPGTSVQTYVDKVVVIKKESIDNDGSVRNVEGWGAKRGPQPLNIPLLN